MVYYICVADIRAGRHKTTLGYSLMVYSNNSGDTSPTRPQSVGGNYSPASALKSRLNIHHYYSFTAVYEQTPMGRSNMLIVIKHTITCPLCWHHNCICIITSPFLLPIHLKTSHLGFHISTVSSPKYVCLCRELRANSPPSQPRAPVGGNPQWRGPISGPSSSALVRMSNAPSPDV